MPAYVIRHKTNGMYHKRAFRRDGLNTVRVGEPEWVADIAEASRFVIPFTLPADSPCEVVPVEA